MNLDHAVYCARLGGPAVDLHPTQWGYLASSDVNDARDGWQVGIGNTRGDLGTLGPTRALLWNGTAASAVDLNAAEFLESGANAVYGGRQGGGQLVGSHDPWHAMLWSGSAESYVDVHPARYAYSEINAMDGAQQVGYGYDASGPYRTNGYRAVLWSGSAASAVELHPSYLTYSMAVAVGDGQQVGFGRGGPIPSDDAKDGHALLWSGSAESVVDLHPARFYSSRAFGVAGGRQVGCGWAPTGEVNDHALIWFGSAESYVDLHELLPAGFTDSRAFSIDEGGNVYGVAWDAAGAQYAVEWAAVPEPGAAVAVGLLGMGLARRGGRRRGSGSGVPRV